MPVKIGPGHRQFTVIPCPPEFDRKGAGEADYACFAANQALSPALAPSASVEAMLMMRGPSEFGQERNGGADHRLLSGQGDGDIAIPVCRHNRDRQKGTPRRSPHY